MIRTLHCRRPTNAWRATADPLRVRVLISNQTPVLHRTCAPGQPCPFLIFAVRRMISGPTSSLVIHNCSSRTGYPTPSCTLRSVSREPDRLTCGTLIRVLPEAADAYNCPALGVPHSYVHKCEVGERRVDPLELIRWCWACGQAPEVFLAELADTLKKRQRTKRG